jgi:hypothetical protein
MVSDEVRRVLASYPSLPDAKALAISPDRYGIGEAAPDAERARQDAMRRCGASARFTCQIYAIGTEVVWSRDAMPMAAARDVRLEPSPLILNPDDVPTLRSEARRMIADMYVPGASHKALALTSGAMWFVRGTGTRAEATRLALERCAVQYQRACLLLAVDNFLTIRIPKSRKIVRTFLPSTAEELSASDRERIGRIYQGAEWRAVARGLKGSWHAVANAPSEAAAIQAALASCGKADEQCQLHAIGNFQVEGSL